jgi:hypothetical protein
MKVIPLRETDRGDFEEQIKQEGLRPVILVCADAEGTPVLTVGDSTTFKEIAYILWVLDVHFKNDWRTR